MTPEAADAPERQQLNYNPRWLSPDTLPTGGIMALVDRRAGTAAQTLGIAERLGEPYRLVALRWSGSAKIPWPWPTLAGLSSDSRHGIAPPWPSLVISAGRRSVPVARWLRRRGAKLVHCGWPNFAPSAFELLVVGKHDRPYEAPNVLPIQGATHRISARVLAKAREEWAEFAALPRPRVGLLVGGPVRGEGLDPGLAERIAAQVAGLSGSVIATTSRRTGSTAAQAVARALVRAPGGLHRWNDSESRNPYAGILAWADILVVTGDSVSMVSEALVSEAPLYIIDPGGLPKRHRAFIDGLVAEGQAKMFVETGLEPFTRTSLDETGRVCAEIRARGLI
jgi:mitochondrial fission protein ELM1